MSFISVIYGPQKEQFWAKIMSLVWEIPCLKCLCDVLEEVSRRLLEVKAGAHRVTWAKHRDLGAISLGVGVQTTDGDEVSHSECVEGDRKGTWQIKR
jgi:hypothetical protein